MSPDTSLKVHPILSNFEHVDVNNLATDIKVNGLTDPIVLSPDGTMILEGRARLAACGVAGVTPRFRHLHKDSTEVDTARFVLTMLLKQADLTLSQRAFVGACYLGFLRDTHEVRRVRLAQSVRENGKFAVKENKVRRRNPLRNLVAKEVGVGATQIQETLRILRTKPDLAIKIRDGELTVKAAKALLIRKIQPSSLEKPGKNSSPPSPENKSKEASAARIDWIRYYAQEERLPSSTIGKRLGILESTVRRLARRYDIEIPDDAWTLKRKKPRFDINRIARVVADDLVAMEESIARLREDFRDITDPEVLELSKIYWKTSTQLRNLAKEIYYEVHPKALRNNNDDDNSA